MKIQVTSPCFDDIGEVLKSMDLPFEQYELKNKIDCEILFLNCGTLDDVDKEELECFVKGGGVLYASDLTSSLIEYAFPNIFTFKGSGDVCTLNAEVVDVRLIKYIGKNVSVTFDLGGWSMLDKIATGRVIIKRIDTGKPLMVEVPYGKGRIYYTSFHNHVQASDKEVALLKLLVLTQLSVRSDKTIEEAADLIGFDLGNIKDKFSVPIVPNKSSSDKLQEVATNNKNVDSIMSKWDKQSGVPQKERQSLPDINSTLSKF